MIKLEISSGNFRRGKTPLLKKTFENIADMINVVFSPQPTSQEGLLDNDDIFNQQSFLDAIDALEQAFLQTTKNYPAQPTHPPTSQSPHQIQTPSFALGLSSTPTPPANNNIAQDIQEDNERIVFDEEEFETTPLDDSEKELFN
nr:platelet glycoprotein Ib alpha chain-like [Ipomoea batatas]